MRAEFNRVRQVPPTAYCSAQLKQGTCLTRLNAFHGESFLSRYAVFCTARALISSKVRSVKAAISS